MRVIAKHDEYYGSEMYFNEILQSLDDYEKDDMGELINSW